LVVRRPAGRSDWRTTSDKRTPAAPRLIECLHHPTNDQCVSRAEDKVRKIGISRSRVKQSVTGVTGNYVSSVISVITNVARS
jgi:hypothetical protein